MGIFTRNVDLKPGEEVYYYSANYGFQPTTILEKLDFSKYGAGGGLTYYLVEKSCHIDYYLDMLTNMQLYTKEQKEEDSRNE